MKKQLTALVLCICMVLSVLPFSSTQAAQRRRAVLAQAILASETISGWETITGSQSYGAASMLMRWGPLMLSDQVLATMAYDAKTSENSATRSHSRNLKRGTYGSNQWRDSNMRSWLNSKAEAGKVEWLFAETLQRVAL